MSGQIDLSPLDIPEALEILFPIVYSPDYLSYNLPFSSTTAAGYLIEVETGVHLSCGFWTASKESPSVLYFHGNGETVTEQDWLAPFYNQMGVNLFAIDYRGYGSSEGKPTVSNLVGDANNMYNGFKEIIDKEQFNRRTFVMGRSLGSVPAVEIALAHQNEISGLVIESGTANNFVRLWHQLGIAGADTLLSEESQLRNKVKIRQVKTPTLIIHGESDDLLPVDEGKELYQNSAAEDKRLLIIPGAGHHDVMAFGRELYLNAIEKFIKDHS